MTLNFMFLLSPTWAIMDHRERDMQRGEHAAWRASMSIHLADGSCRQFPSHMMVIFLDFWISGWLDFRTRLYYFYPWKNSYLLYISILPFTFNPKQLPLHSCMWERLMTWMFLHARMKLDPNASFVVLCDWFTAAAASRHLRYYNKETIRSTAPLPHISRCHGLSSWWRSSLNESNPMHHNRNTWSVMNSSRKMVHNRN